MHDAFRIAPLADLTINEMAAEKRKQQRIAAANLDEVGPVRRGWPENDRFAADAPRHQPSARARRAVENGGVVPTCRWFPWVSVRTSNEQAARLRWRLNSTGKPFSGNCD